MSNKLQYQSFTIPLAEEKKRIINWQAEQISVQAALKEDHGSLINAVPLTAHAFTYHLEELRHLITLIAGYNDSENGAQNPVNAVRFYLGKRSVQNNPAYSSPDLMAVAVAGFNPNYSEGGLDVINITPWAPDASGIFDFSYPCPTTCGNLKQSLLDCQEVDTKVIGGEMQTIPLV